MQIMRKKTMSKKNIIILSLIGIIAVVLIYFGITSQPIQSNKISDKNNIQIVAAENFWGSLVSQLGGDRVSVTSIVSDPNADPHEYESNAETAKIFETANYVIINGAGYDSWSEKLLSSDNNLNRKVLNVSNFLGKKDGDNPHFWYNPDYVNAVIAQMEKDLISIDPSNAKYYQEQYLALQKNLAPYQNRVLSIKQQFGGTPIACTESIFVYPAQALGLNLISPLDFMDAIDEGNDPPAQSVIKFEELIKDHKINVLVYNAQTVTPITETIKKMAADNNIPVIGITETIQPPDVSFQDWMNSELISLENALNAKTLEQ